MASGTSLRRRLTISLLALFALSWCATGVFIFLETQREVDFLLDAHLRQSAALLTAQASHELSEIVEVPGTLGDEVVDLRAYEPKVAFQLWRPNGQLIARSRDAPARRLSDGKSGFADVTIEGLHWRVFSGTANDGQLSVQVAEDHAVRGAHRDPHRTERHSPNAGRPAAAGTDGRLDCLAFAASTGATRSGRGDPRADRAVSDRHQPPAT